MFKGDPPIPPVPDWDQLDKAAIEADCFPSHPGPDDPIFDFSDDVLAELTTEDKWLLLPPQERWAVTELPKELRLAVRARDADKKHSRRAEKFKGLHDKCRSKHWQNLKSLAGDASKPVPCAKASKKSRARAAADAESAAVAKPKPVLTRFRWRNKKLTKKEAAAVVDTALTASDVLVAAQPAGMASACSFWIKKSVRVMSDKVAPELLNRSGIVTAVVPLPDGTLDLRVQRSSSDERSAVFYISSVDVIVELSDPAGAVPKAGSGELSDPVGAAPQAVAAVTMPSVLDFSAAAVAKWDPVKLAELPPNPVTLKLGSLVEYGSLSYALLEF